MKLSAISAGGTLDSASVAINNSEWYRVTVTWQTDGYMEATVYNTNGTQIAVLNGTDTTYTDGGINFGADNGAGQFDYYAINESA